MNKHEVARLHLLPMLLRYRWMSESVHHDEQSSSLHCRKCFLYDEQCSSLHTEGLISIKFFSSNFNDRISWISDDAEYKINPVQRP